MINRDAIYLPTKNELVVVRGSNANQTTEWAFNIDLAQWIPGGKFTLELSGRIIGADFNTDLDSRVSNQKATIDRLLDHVRAHCPQLQARGTCPHLNPGETQ